MTAVDHTTTATEDVDRSAKRWSAPIVAGVLAGPLFVIVIVIQALIHADFDLAEHPLSLLALGEQGWIQTLNFIACGTAVVAAALTERRTTGLLSTWTRRMITTYGVAVIVAGVFPADPWHGYPVGADETTTWHGVIHSAAAATAGIALVVATITSARFARRLGHNRWASASLAVGVGYLIASMVAGATGDLRIAFLGGAVIWCWASGVLAATQIRRTLDVRSSTRGAVSL